MLQVNNQNGKGHILLIFIYTNIYNVMKRRHGRFKYSNLNGITMVSAFPSYSFKKVPKELIALRPRIRQGELTEHGYNLHSSPESRHAALNKDIKQDGAAKTFHRLTLLKVFNKNRPALRRTIDADLNWMRRAHGKELHRSLALER